MTETASLAAAFMAGLLGGVHCLGMCGGIVGALTLGLKRDDRTSGPPWRFLLAYNAGRLASYTAAGALMGGIGGLLVALAPVRNVQTALLVIAGVFMILLGLYLGGWWRILARVEHVGGHLWRRIEPLGRRFLPVRTPAQALAIGLVWGWIPCGLVYTMLIWTVAAGGAAQGAMIMLAFGAGTLPNLVAMGLFASALTPWLRRPQVKWAAGAMVVVLGVVVIWRAF
jgi:sulfite exporter TauE/SafE